MVPPLPAYEGGSLRCFHFKAGKCLILSVSSPTKSPFHLFLPNRRVTRHYYSLSLHPLFLCPLIHHAAASFSLIVTHLLHVYNRITCRSLWCVSNEVKQGRRVHWGLRRCRVKTWHWPFMVIVVHCWDDGFLTSPQFPPKNARCILIHPLTPPLKKQSVIQMKTHIWSDTETGIRQLLN